MVSLDLSRNSGFDELLALVSTFASSWMEAALLDPAGGAREVVDVQGAPVPTIAMPTLPKSMFSVRVDAPTRTRTTVPVQYCVCPLIRHCCSCTEYLNTRSPYGGTATGCDVLR
jgi:hypothetical protein